MSSDSYTAGRVLEAIARPFTYRSVSDSSPGENGTPETSDSVAKRLWMLRGTAVEASALEERLKQARQKGFEDAREQAHNQYQKELAELQQQIAGAVHEFTVQRQAYFTRVEEEVVRLALGIARKILHRETQIDPLLLAGMVRVALEKLGSGISVRLRANPAEVNAWHDFFDQTRDVQPSPDVIGDSSLEQGHCLLETDLGTTEIGLETQLKEIEQGFLDLLAQRPGSP